MVALPNCANTPLKKKLVILHAVHFARLHRGRTAIRDNCGPQLIPPPTALYSIPMAIIVRVLLFSGEHGDRKGHHDNANWWCNALVRCTSSETSLYCFQAWYNDRFSLQTATSLQQGCTKHHATSTSLLQDRKQYTVIHRQFLKSNLEYFTSVQYSRGAQTQRPMSPGFFFIFFFFTFTFTFNS